MVKQILEHARPAMQLSIAIFFLVASGWVVRLYWVQEPIQALGQRLLAKDGALFIKILSNDKTISSIRRLTAPSGKAKPRPGALHHLIDRLVAKDGALLKSLSTQLLVQPTVQKLLLRPSPRGSTGKPSPLVALGKHAIDQLLAKDAALAEKLAISILSKLQPNNAKSPKVAKQVPDSWAMIERLGRHAIERLFAKRADLAIHVTERLIASQQKKHSPSSNKKSRWDPQALVKGLGEHAIDRLTASRAQPLRAILQSILGPEPMRALQSLRQVIQQLSTQLNQLQVAQLAREAAYQLGRGGLEAFLQEQRKTKQQEARMQRKVQARRAISRKDLRKSTPCFVPRGTRWLRYQKGAITASLFVLHQRRQCRAQLCEAQRRKAHALLWKMHRDLIKDRADLTIELTPGCHPKMAKRPPPPRKPQTRRPPRKRTVMPTSARQKTPSRKPMATRRTPPKR